MSAAEAALAVKEQALRLGFDACGIAAVSDVRAAIDPEDRLGDWLERGCHADMKWMERTKAARQDIQRVLPKTRSVVVVARSYYAEPTDGGPASGDRGRVARYAWGQDYHRVLREPLESLGGFISTIDRTAEWRAYIDTGPVLEKFWAARAGIGWIGKNSLIVCPGLGSWVVLGVLLTTANLSPDTPLEDRCGECTECLRACPTAAIVEPRMVDARRCISYLTVEHRSDIPFAQQRQMGDWVFGCDACQEVCPWNRDVTPASEPEFGSRAGYEHETLDLDWLAGLSEAEFREAFSGTSLTRAGLAGLRRDAAIARENLSGKEGMDPSK